MRGEDSQWDRSREAALDAAGAAIVIPAFDEAGTIAPLVRACRALPEAIGVIVVDDGSADQTAVLAAAAGARLLPNGVNLGKGESLRRGMRAALAAGAAFIVTLDADGQHRPEDIPRLLAAAAPGLVVIGARVRSPDAPRARRVANRVADFWVSWAARQRIRDTQSGFRVYPAALAALLVAGAAPAQHFAFESEALIAAARAGYATRSVPIPTIYHPGLRPSHFRAVRDIARIVRMVAGKLLPRLMDPVGLWRSLRPPPRA
ncbi:MAG: glycosyltransferase family 2 protein [Rhodospirillales bacterium]|nr:glycosyltransferase family 2 protein [Rhodospirillales bacterium]